MVQLFSLALIFPTSVRPVIENNMTQSDHQKDPGYEVVDLYLDLAKTLYEAGATVQRVSDSVRWLAQSLGDTDVHVFVGYEAIELSIHHGYHTENRLYVLREPFRVNIAVLHRVSILLHEISAYQGNITAIRTELENIQKMKPIYPVVVTILLTGIACAAFGWINHADIPALLVIGISAICALTIRVRFGKKLNNIYLSTLLTALSGGFCAVVLIPLSYTKTPEVALISSVLFLIPGFLLINAGLDIIRDHTSCGIVRLTSAFTHICIISGSLLIPLSILGTSIYSYEPGGNLYVAIMTTSLAAGIAAFGFALLFNAPLFVLPGCMICGIVARLVRETGIFWGFDTFFCIFMGMVCATLVTSFFARITHVPEVFLSVIAGIPMIPGLALIQGLQGMFTIAHTGTQITDVMLIYSLQQILYAGVAAFALVGGIILPIIVLARTSLRI